MAHTKAQKAVKGNRDSRSKRRGVKLFGGQVARIGYIIVRQKGSKFNPGVGTFMAKDFTIHAGVDGVIRFHKQRGKMYIHVDPAQVKSETKTTEKASKPAKKSASKKAEPEVIPGDAAETAAL